MFELWTFIFFPCLNNFAASSRTLTKCCPHGEAFDFPSVSTSPLRRSEQSPKCLPIFGSPGTHNLTKIKTFTSGRFFNVNRKEKNDSNGTVKVLTISHLPNLCYEGSPHVALVEKVSHDGFVTNNGVEQPYDCVDELLEENDGKERKEKESKGEKPKFAALTCRRSANCPVNHRCVEKCCKEGQLLVQDEDKSSRPRCVHGSSLWKPEQVKDGVVDILRTSIFYKIKNLEVCYTSKSQYSITQDGSLLSLTTNSTTRTYCADYLQEKGGNVKEVIVTQPKLCAKGDRVEAREEEVGDDDQAGFSAVLYIVCAVLSLVCLTLTFLIYWFIPSYNHLAGKIVLINVVSTALLSIFLLLLYFVAPSTFHLECAKEDVKVCVFIRSYACPLIGYFGYFTFIGAFAWMTVMGFDLCWRFFTSEGRDHTTSSRSKQ